MASRFRDSTVDDDVEFLYEVSPEPLVCQMCSRNLDKDTPEERNAHYQAHFKDEPRGSSSSCPPKNSKPSFKAKTFDKAWSLFPARKRDNEDLFWYTSQAGPPPSNHTPAGLIPILRVQLGKSRNTQRAWLCSDVAVHTAIEWMDRGWGCGYRNFSMTCSALMAQTEQPLYFPLIEHPVPPGVRNLQLWIEDAWSKGFDQEGAQQLKRKLYDTNKWIGTAELWVAFASRGIPSHLVDFSIGDKQDVDLLLSWIEEYFSQDAPKQSQNALEALKGASPVTVTTKMPLVLQHPGHSRTIVGFERCENGSINLLEFDPSKKIPPNIREAALAKSRASSSNGHSPLKRRASDLPNVAAKRMRSGTRQDAILIDSDDDENAPAVGSSSTSAAPANGSSNPEPVLNTADVLKFFRLPAKSLNRHKKYQILYFPLSDPLTDQERLKRRVVMSFKVERNTS
ncbi:hypothetical protein EUX98_g1181 [Antrodiella citrinella]|uniref:UFSP1/2/DUB catalytic domain-containing protein n=1 Tax=Antrodiella citrinella TaxID=2447956 RepID=A0A4S4NAJ7_9APHY|nr:hypothetical protein EUX98_g1181 [Antrodiella citrinella]